MKAVKEFRVRCEECGWTGYRRQKSTRYASLDSCPQCGAPEPTPTARIRRIERPFLGEPERACIVSEKNGEARLKPEGECSFSDEILTHFIERDPVLDLLERAYAILVNRHGESELTKDIKPVLLQHGRTPFDLFVGRLGGET